MLFIVLPELAYACGIDARPAVKIGMSASPLPTARTHVHQTISPSVVDGLIWESRYVPYAAIASPIVAGQRGPNRS